MDANSCAKFISLAAVSFQQILGDTNFGQVLIYLMKDANWQTLVSPPTFVLLEPLTLLLQSDFVTFFVSTFKPIYWE